MPSSYLSSTARRSDRDLRIDFFRGLALIFIFIDHSPGNALAAMTLHSFGFADAAEVFVLLAGYSATLAYGRKLDGANPSDGVEQVGLRVGQIYLWHLTCLAIAVVLLFAASHYFGTDRYTGGIGVKQFAETPAIAVISAALLILQPNLFNILPLYVVLLAVFPVLFLLLRYDMRIGLGVSALIWLASGWLHLPLAGGERWFFNPFAWQFLIALGAAAAMTTRRGRLPQSRALLAVAVGYVAFALVYAAPWAQIPALADFRVIPAGSLGIIDKTNVSVWRLAHVLALGYIAVSLIAPRADWLNSRLTRAISRCGRHSLEIFSLGLLLSLVGWIAFEEFGTGLPVQVAVNVVGVGVLGYAAWWLSNRRRAAARQVNSTAHIVTAPALARSAPSSSRSLCSLQFTPHTQAPGSAARPPTS